MSAQQEWGPASIGIRLPAALIDWIVLVVASYTVFPILLFAAGARGWWCLAGGLGLSLGSMALAWAKGWSPGIATTGIRLVRARDGRPPGYWRAAARTLLVFPGGSAAVSLALIVYAAWMGHYPTGAGPAFSLVRILALAGVASTYLGMVAIGLRGSRRQALYDRILGLGVLEPKRLTIPRPAPPPRPPKARRQVSRWWLILVGAIALWEVIALVALVIGVSGGQYGAVAFMVVVYVGLPCWAAFELVRRMRSPVWLDSTRRKAPVSPPDPPSSASDATT